MAKSTETLTEQLAEARAKVAELETFMKSYAVGKLAYVKNLGLHGDVNTGAILKITENDGDDYPLRGVLLDDSDYDYFKIEHIEVLSYERARELLIAEVDRKLAEVYPVEAKGRS